jgi:hypothetical protein
MVLTRRQLQEREQQQQKQQMAMENSSTINGAGNSTQSTGPSPLDTTPNRSTNAHHIASKTLQHQAMEVATATKRSQQQQSNGQQPQTPQRKTAITPQWVYVLLVLFALLTILTIPKPFHPTIQDGPSVRHVFYYGWLTAMSTGLGALPFLLYPDVATYWVGISNGKIPTGINCFGYLWYS